MNAWNFTKNGLTVAQRRILKALSDGNPLNLGRANHFLREDGLTEFLWAMPRSKIMLGTSEIDWGAFESGDKWTTALPYPVQVREQITPKGVKRLAQEELKWPHKLNKGWMPRAR